MKLPESNKDWARLVLFLAGAFALFQLVKAVLPDVDLQQLLEDVSDGLGAWTYLIVGAFAFLETGAFVGLVVPGETVVVLAGAVAGQEATSVILTIGIVWAAAFLGDTASFMLGRKLGRNFVLEHGPKLRITRERFAQVEGYFENHGGKTILIGRFIGLVRALAPFVAGSSGMAYRAMAPFSILGTGLWAATFTVLGYFASQNIEEVLHASERGLFFIAIAIVTIVAGIVVYRQLRDPAKRSALARRMEANTAGRRLVSLGRRIEPQARFLWRRMTPGNLGLEFTAVIATLAVAAFTVVFYVDFLDGNLGPTPGDEIAIDLVDGLRSDALTSLAKVVTVIGSGWLVTIVAVLAAGWLGWKRHWEEAIAVLVGLAIIAIAVPELKDAVARPRPPEGLVETRGNAFPSGHATYATVYAWISIILALRIRPGMSRASAIALAGVAVTVLIGLSRVYLDVHYMSDVFAGWGLGIAALSLTTAIAILVSHIRASGPVRQNPRRGA